MKHLNLKIVLLLVFLGASFGVSADQPMTRDSVAVFLDAKKMAEFFAKDATIDWTESGAGSEAKAILPFDMHLSDIFVGVKIGRIKNYSYAVANTKITVNKDGQSAEATSVVSERGVEDNKKFLATTNERLLIQNHNGRLVITKIVAHKKW
jgi:hypothetical protein